MKKSAAVWTTIAAAAWLAVAAAATAAEPEEGVVAKVNDKVIDEAQFLAFFNRARRQEFYHRTPPPDELESFRSKTLQDLIDRFLLEDEARRLGLEPDAEKIQSEIDRITARYEGNPSWEEGKERMTASLRSQLEGGDLIEQVERRTRDVGIPSEAQLKAFFEANPETFTEPAQRRVSLILIGLNPSALQAEREKAQAEAGRVVDMLRSGDDFAMLAEAYSADPSAENGGDMGWLHTGLLNDQAEEALASMAVGEVSDPIRTLEGYAILRLDEVREPEKKTLDEVRERAVALWQREEGERAWAALKQRLRSDAEIRVLDPTLQLAAESGSA